MAWLRLDDGFTKHPKFDGWTPTQRWAWLEVMEYCARYQTCGKVPADLSLMPRSTSHGLLAKAVESGWLDVHDDGSRWVHDWSLYNPKDPTKAERQARWRQKRNAHVDDDVDAPGDETVDGQNVHSRAGATRVPVPSPKETPPNPPTGGNRRTSEQRRTDRFADNLNADDRTLWDFIVQGDQLGIVTEYQNATGLRYVRGSHGSSWKLDPLGNDQKPGGFEAGQVPPGYAGKPSPGEFLQAWLRQFTTFPVRSGTEVLLQLVEPSSRARKTRPEGDPDAA